ncbi:MAG: hypothetical protein EOS85_34505, partial [Mesorhizobium sp.]
MTDEIDSFIGVAQPWLCDEFGHMNRRFYAAMFDDATLVVLRFLDVDDRQDSLGWADVRTETRAPMLVPLRPDERWSLD